MIVPVIVDFFPNKEARFLYEFYSAIRMEKKGVVVATNDYDNRLEYFKNKGRSECDAIYGVYGKNERMISQEDIDDVKVFTLNPDEYANDLNLNRKELNLYLVDNRYPALEELLDNVYAYIKERDLSIDALMMFRQYKSIDMWAERNDVPIIYYDLSAYRYPVYKTFFYLDSTGWFNKTGFASRFRNFKNHSTNVPIFSRLELLLLMLNYGHESAIEYLYRELSDEIGVFFQDNIINYQIKKIKSTNSELLAKAMKKHKDQTIRVRVGPVETEELPEKVEIDNSEFAYEAISKCRIVYSRMSNISYETMLWNRCANVSEKGLYSFIANESMKNNSEQEILLFLNFATFSLFLPQEKLRDADYLRWRCRNQSDVKIYMDNLTYILRTFGLNEEFLRLDKKDRIIKLLKLRGFNKEEINCILERENL